ncbi:hypothetical protein D3C76_683900 [compost metagenome]
MRGRDGFDHHIAQGAGLDQLTLARHNGRLDGQQLAANLGPGQPGHLADLILLLGQAVAELAHAEEMLQRIGSHRHGEVLVTGVFLDHLAAHLGDLPLQATHTGFAGVVADNVANSLVLELKFGLLQAIGLDLLGRQVLDRDIDLFIFGVAGQTNHLHPIEQRRRNVHGIGGAQEHHVGQVVVDFQVMVVEVVVLLRVEHFQQRRSRVATHVAAHLVDFVEQEQRVADTHFCHLLNQSSWHRTDVSTAMTTNFRLVTHTAEGHAHEFAVGGVSNRLRQGRFTHPGRTDQAQHRTTNFLHAFLHGEVFEDAFLDLFQAIVVGIEDIFGTRQVQAYLALGLPRYLHQPIDIGTHHGGFGRHGRHLLELVQLGQRLGQGILGQAGSVDALFQVFNFVVAFVAVAELFLNGLHLLIQVVLALAALHLLLHAATDALLDLQQVDFGIQQGQDVLDPCGQIDDLQDFLLLLDFQRHVRGHGVYQAAGLIDAVERRQDFSRDFLAQLHILFELRQQAAHEDFRLTVRRGGLFDQGNLGPAVAFDFDKALNRTALLAFDQHLDGAIGQLQQLQNSGNGTDTIQSVFTRIIVSRIFLRQQKNLLLASHRCLEGFDGLLAPHEQRDNHMRIYNNITQWQERQFEGCLHDFASTAATWP